MPYDPNDPNQGSQAPPEDQSTPEWQAKNAMTTGTINDLIRSRPAIQAWLALHDDGKHLSDAEKSELFGLMQRQGIDARTLEIDDDTGTISWPKHTVRDIAYGSLLAFGPIVAGWALPYVGAAPAANSSWDAAGNFIGPSSVTEGGSLASLGTVGTGVTDVAAGSGAPLLDATAISPVGTLPAGTTPSLASVGTGASTVAETAAAPVADYTTNSAGTVMDAANVPAETANSLGKTIGDIANSRWFPAIVGTAANIYSAKTQADASEEASKLQSQAAKDALDFAKSQAAIERQNFAPYLTAGTGALSKLSYGLGIGSPSDYNSNGMPATPPGGSPGSLTPYGDPQVSPKSPAGQFITNTKTQPVWMTAPTGERQQVPANQVQHYLSLGAKLDPGQGLDGGSVPRTGSLALIGRTPPPGAENIGMATPRI